jgi:hypothetical protein
MKTRKQQYIEELAKKQKEHLEKIQSNIDYNWKPCLHDQCTQCHGTGIKQDGFFCVHSISCSCPKCTVMC